MLQRAPGLSTLLVWFAASAALIVGLCLFFEPAWETNDDVGLSMRAHGYGGFAVGSPLLLLSNVLWGHFVRALPTVNGLLGYSMATLGVLILVGAVVGYGLHRIGVDAVSSLALMALLLVRPVLFAQFTINAGLLVVAAVVLWRVFTRCGGNWHLAAGCVLAWAGFLVRGSECLLTLIVAAPLMTVADGWWEHLPRRRAVTVAGSGLVAAAALAALVDWQAYRAPEWRAVREARTATLPLLDYRAADRLRERPDILARHGFSENDLILLASWFHVDPQLLRLDAIRAMLDELGPRWLSGRAVAQGWVGAQTLWRPSLGNGLEVGVLPLVMAALLLVIVQPGRRALACWGLALASFFLLGLAGRPSIIRVYIPIVSLLVVAPLLDGSSTPGRRRRHAVAVLLVSVAAINGWIVATGSRATSAVAAGVRRDLSGFPSTPVANWSGSFPLELVYPVLRSSPAALAYRFHNLSTDALAPTSVAFAERQAGRGFLERLGGDGVPLIAREPLVRALATYCREHQRGHLRELSASSYGAVVVSTRRCEVTP